MLLGINIVVCLGVLVTGAGAGDVQVSELLRAVSACLEAQLQRHEAAPHDTAASRQVRSHHYLNAAYTSSLRPHTLVA
jgi:hypothetical protein